MQMLRRLGGLVFVALLLSANPAIAQTSSVAIVPESLPSGDVAATPVKPLEISDIDYPFESLLANEGGDVTLALAIDPSGRVRDARLAGLSRFQNLNQQSLRIGRQRWQFNPATRDGMPVESTLSVKIAWRPPLEPVEFKIPLPSLPAGVEKPKATTSHAVILGDYPNAAIRGQQQGFVSVGYFVDAKGNVTETRLEQSSGFPLLDSAARNMVKRWKYEPATANGAPVGVWMPTVVMYRVEPPSIDRKLLRCYPQPMVYDGKELVLVNGSPFPPTSPPTKRFERWTYVDDKAVATDTLLQTSLGLMRVSEPVREAMKRADYPRPNGKGCWYYDPIYTQR